MIASTEALKAELAIYEKNKASLMANGGEGRFVLIHDGEIAGVWDSYTDALQAGYERFGLTPFMVKQIQGIEGVQLVTREIAPCRS